MSAGKTVNLAASVHHRLLNLSKERGEFFQFLLTKYATERLLYRISVSEYADQFVLKGAMLFAVWAETPYRPTKDLDLLAFGDPDPDKIRSTMETIIRNPVEDDGLRFDSDSIRIEETRVLDQYNGFRIWLIAYLGAAKCPVQIDLGYGDVVTPEPEIIVYPTLLDFPAPKLRAYPPASVAAEKLQAIVALGMGNSRMKDYYDLLVICNRFSIKQKEIVRAVKATFKRRQTQIPTDMPIGLSDEFGEDRNNQILWKRFLKRNSLTDVSEDLSDTVNFLRKQCMPVFIKALRK